MTAGAPRRCPRRAARPWLGATSAARGRGATGWQQLTSGVRQGTILDMLEDVNGGIAWTLAHAAEHGGDPQRTYLVGQSCGAQLAALSLVTQARARPAPAWVVRAHP